MTPSLDPAAMTDQQLVDMMRRIAEEIPQSGAAAARRRLQPYMAEAKLRVQQKKEKRHVN